MKPLFSAFLETIVLIVSILIVMLGVRIFKYESPYVNYSETHPNGVITIGQATGYVSEGVTSPKAAAAEAAQKVLGKKTTKTFPTAVGKFLCIEVGENTARVLEGYTFIVLVESIICLIFGITLPCSLYRHLDPAKAIDNALINKNYVYADNCGTYGYVGETRAGILKFLLFIFMFFIANVWCTLLPFFIVINFAVGIVMAIMRLVGIKASNSIAKAGIKMSAGKARKDTYRLIVEDGHFAVAGDVHPERKLYFKQYWNAVIAQRVFELDRDGDIYSDEDAKETITFGDENRHKGYETSRRMNKFGMLFSPSARKRSSAIEKVIKQVDYNFTFAERGGKRCEYLMIMPDGENYMIFEHKANCAFMHEVMEYDAKNEMFDMIAWNDWCRLGCEGIDGMAAKHAGLIAPPKGEEAVN